MADNVTGFIGQDAVNLENAATEATLAAILAAITGGGDGGGAAAVKLKDLATKAGVNTQKFDELKNSIDQVLSPFSALSGQLIRGQASISQVYTAFSSLPGPIGAAASGLAALARFQEEAVMAQQELSRSGANFGGSLNDVRQSAANSFMTLTEFSAAVSKNRDVINTLGGSMQAGVRKFVDIQNSLLAPGSETQQNLATLGYSAADAAELTGSYMRAQGTMNKDSLKDNKAISAGIAEYAQQLDQLSQLTGKSRQELQAKMDKENTEAQWNAALAGMSKDKADKLRQGMQMAMAQGGQGAVDAFKAMALGLPPMTEAGRMYMATQRAGVEALKSYNRNASDASLSTKEASAANRAALAKQISDGKQDREALQKVLQADALAGGKLSESFADATKLQTKFQGMTEEQIKQELDAMSVAEEKTKSDAAAMDEGKKQMQAFVAALMPAINMIMTVVTPVLKYLTPILAGLALAFGALKVVTMAVAAWESSSLAIKKAKAAYAAGGASGLGSSILDKVKGGGTATPSTGGLSGPAPAGGGGFVGFIKSLGRGLASLAPIAVPMLIGAGAVAGVIALLGAGVAAAVALIGLSLPTFATGLKSIAEIDGLNLLAVAGGIAALGAAMVAFTAGSVIAGLGSIGTGILNFFSGGGPIGQIKTAITELTPVLPQLTAIGPALNNYSQGIIAFGRAVNSVDIAKADQLKKVLSGPSPAEQMANAGAQMIQAATNFVTGKSGTEEKSHLELTALNNNVKELAKYMKDIAENTKRTVDATKNLNGNLWAA